MPKLFRCIHSLRVFAVMLLVGLAGPAVCAEGETRDSFEILEGLPLSDVEGLWSMTSENLLVLVIREESGRLKMTVAPESETYGFVPGQVVGYLEPTTENDAFWLLLEDVPASKSKKLKNVAGTFPFSRRCVLRVKEKGDVLAIEKGDASITFNPLCYFPYLNRLIRLRFSNPEAKIREGFRKIAPGFDGGVGTRQRPVYY